MHDALTVVSSGFSLLDLQTLIHLPAITQCTRISLHLVLIDKGFNVFPKVRPLMLVAQPQGVAEFMNDKVLFMMVITSTKIKPHVWLFCATLTFSVPSIILPSF